MQRHRVLIVFGIAWLSALLLSVWLYRQATAPDKRSTVKVVAAARDLQLGKRLVAADLKLVEVDRSSVPAGASYKVTDVVDRSVAVATQANELVIERKLAAKGSGEGITALIEPGMRAVSVPVNESSGVNGFAQPGTRVDVLFTRVSGNNEATTTTILQNVKVLAFGKQIEPGGKAETRTAGGQTVATLMVTQEQAEKLALAVQRGRVQLALRNPLDNELNPDGHAIHSSQLVGESVPPRPLPRPVVSPVIIHQRPAGKVVAAAKARDAADVEVPATPETVKPLTNGKIVVKVYRGSKVTEETFQ